MQLVTLRASTHGARSELAPLINAKIADWWQENPGFVLMSCFPPAYERMRLEAAKPHWCDSVEVSFYVLNREQVEVYSAIDNNTVDDLLSGLEILSERMNSVTRVLRSADSVSVYREDSKPITVPAIVRAKLGEFGWNQCIDGSWVYNLVEPDEEETPLEE